MAKTCYLCIWKNKIDMKKIILILLIGFFSCSESMEIIDEPESNLNCYVLVAKGTQNGRFIPCDSGLVVGLVQKRLYDTGNYSLFDRIEICATSGNYTFSSLRFGQIFCDLSVFTE